MKRTFFSLGKSIFNVRHYSTMPPITVDHGIFINMFNILPSDKQRLHYEKIFADNIQEIKKNIDQGNEYLTNRSKRNPLASLKAYEQSAKIAEVILQNLSIESLNHPNKLILAQAFASYANVLRKLKPEEIDIREAMVEKALKLDPDNKRASALKFEMNFYDIVPEPLRIT